ncbi:MAG TPA: hypothetical protein VFQ88_08825 [Nevskiaceae bacterium]|nr:hypothetical protein [Nevskiaceae bacterium]
MFIRGGYNVYPAEIENLLSKQAAVSMCAVIGIPDEKYGQTGCAFILPAPGTAVDTAALADLCRRSLAEYKVPDRFVVVDKLPLTPAGKIRKVALEPPKN